jgi:hypothetical protein
MRKHPIITAFVVGMGSLVLFGGCQEKEPPPVAYIGPTLTAADLGGPSAHCPPTGFVILEDGSEGRWPAAVAVAFIDEASDGSGWQIETLKEETATWWNQLFTTVPVVREVLVMDQLTLISPSDDIDAILAKARRLKTRLVILYGHGSAPLGQAALTGVIRDTLTGHPVALVRAQAGPADYTEHRVDTVEEDMRHIDPDYLVARKFEQQVRQCVLELIARDKPPATTQPSAWEDHSRQQKKPLYIIRERSIDW